MSMIVNIPIEPIEQRYSADWNRWFYDELTNRQIKFDHLVADSMSDKIREGAFLDVIGTMHYKAQQVQLVAEHVNQGIIPRNERVIFIIHDGWFPVEQLAYMRDMLGCYEWKFVGIFHAGTYDRWDQTAQHGMYTYGEDLENAWFKIYDRIIVASNFHRDLLLRTRRVDSARISVIPWKVEVPQLPNVYKENWIVFPHRHDPEKQPEKYYAYHKPIPEETLQNGWEFKSTKNCSKQDYYLMLKKSKIAVSFSLQETFGIAMVEAVLLGCIPLVPDRLSYKEMYPETFRYSGESEFKGKLECFCTKPFTVKTELLHLQDKFKMQNGEFFNSLFDVMEDL